MADLRFPSAISSLAPIAEDPKTGTSSMGGKAGADFASALVDALGEAGRAEKAADEATLKFAQGDPTIGIHEVMIATEKASIAMKFAVTVKNKALEAYRDLMNTPV
jgi:flagellar hook-basal body complex protein FliE